MTDLVHDTIIAVASFLGNPRDVLVMASVCVAWYDTLESDRARLLALTFGVEPWARCSGSTSLGDALGLWNMYLHAKCFRVMERDIEPGMTTPLRTQLALIEPLTMGPVFQTFLGYRTDLSPSLSERRYVLADGLMTHATLFGNALRPGLQRMWNLCNARAHGRCLYLLLASPMESIPMEDLVQEYMNVPRFFGVMLVFHHAFKPLLEEWTGDQIKTRAVTFVTRFTQFVGHSATRSRFVGAYHAEHEQLPFGCESIGIILGKLLSKCIANRNALEKACTACLDVFDRGVIVDIDNPHRGIWRDAFALVQMYDNPGH